MTDVIVKQLYDKDDNPIAPPTISSQVIDPETQKSVKVQIDELNTDLSKLNNKSKWKLLTTTTLNTEIDISSIVATYDEIYVLTRNTSNNPSISVTIPTIVLDSTTRDYCNTYGSSNMFVHTDNKTLSVKGSNISNNVEIYYR